MAELLELVERLADLNIKRARIHEVEEAAWRVASTGDVMHEARQKAKIYSKARRILFAEIQRIEALIEVAGSENA